MTRTLAAGAVLTTLMFCVQPAAAAEAPWCAVLQNSTESVYWDCQYGSIEQCRQTVLAGNRGWCHCHVRNGRRARLAPGPDPRPVRS